MSLSIKLNIRSSAASFFSTGGALCTMPPYQFQLSKFKPFLHPPSLLLVPSLHLDQFQFEEEKSRCDGKFIAEFLMYSTGSGMRSDGVKLLHIISCETFFPSRKRSFNVYVSSLYPLLSRSCPHFFLLCELFSKMKFSLPPSASRFAVPLAPHANQFEFLTLTCPDSFHVFCRQIAAWLILLELN